MSEGGGERTALRRWAVTLALSGSGSRAGGEVTRNAGWASAEGGGELGHARDGPAPGRGRTERTGLGSWAAGKGKGRTGPVGFLGRVRGLRVGLPTGFGLVGLGFTFFYFFSSLQLTQTNSNSNSNLNSTLTLKQIKQCASMNATSRLNLKNLITCETKIRLNASLNTINLRNLNKAN